MSIIANESKRQYTAKRKQLLPNISAAPNNYDIITGNYLNKAFTQKHLEMARRILSNRFKKVIYPPESHHHNYTCDILNIKVNLQLINRTFREHNHYNLHQLKD